MFSKILYLILLFIILINCKDEIKEPDNIVCIDDECKSLETEIKNNEPMLGLNVIIDIVNNDKEKIFKELNEFGLNWIFHPIDQYYISDTEITVRQFKKCVNDGYCNSENFNKFRFGCTYENDEFEDNYPINCVNFFAAEEMCSYVGGYICSENEWNKACEGLDTGKLYPYGNKFKPNYCNVGLYEDKLSPEPVKSRENCIGGLDNLYDMGGSLSEWINEGSDNYRKFKALSYAFNGPVDKQVCTKMCAGNQRDFMSPVIGIRCCKKY
jgi:formylglycine-generating enzyme required for sulfatase activity